MKLLQLPLPLLSAGILVLPGLTNVTATAVMQAHTSTLLQVIPTPLTRLRWWRICLDEAQLVESSTAKAAELAARLDGVHRWAVSGTPIARGLEDLHGLMVFLHAWPWSERGHWARAIQRPCEAGDAAGTQNCRMVSANIMCLPLSAAGTSFTVAKPTNCPPG